MNILQELRQRSKYLPALLKEFKKLEINLEMDQPPTAHQRSFSHPPCSEISDRPVGNSEDTLSGITCATILAAIKTTRDKQRGCRGKKVFATGKPTHRIIIIIIDGKRSVTYHPLGFVRHEL